MSQNTWQKVTSLLSMIAVIAVILGVKIITSRMDSIAAGQFGGAENYALAQKLFATDGFKQNQKQQLENALESFSTAGAEKTDNAVNPDATANEDQKPASTDKLTQAQLLAIKKDAYVEGASDAAITIVEYSDLECPYCIRHFNDKTIENVVGAFPKQVNHIFKVVQGVDHPGTKYKSYASLCAGQLAGLKGYLAMYQGLFAASTPQAAVANDKVFDIASTVGIKKADLESCITLGAVQSVYAANRAEFQQFTDKPGTPGNVVINNKTGEWKLVAGAYPKETFTQIINAWLVSEK